jgi:hypothetical protein
MTQEQIKEQIKERIIAIIDCYTTNMEMSAEHRDNYGVHQSDYEDIAEDIYKEFDIIG